MKIHFATDAPANGVDQVRAALLDLLNEPSCTIVFPRSFAPDELRISDPQRVYSVGLDALAHGALLSKARARAWRYLLAGPNGWLGECEIVETKTAVVVSSFTHGRAARGSLDALKSFEATKGLPDTDWEMRMLHVAGLGFVAVWFHAKAHDRIVPIPPTVCIPVLQVFEDGAVIAALRAQAKHALATQKPKPGTTDHIVG